MALTHLWTLESDYNHTIMDYNLMAITHLWTLESNGAHTFMDSRI